MIRSIKNKLPVVWVFIDSINALFCRLFWNQKITKIQSDIISSFDNSFTIKKFNSSIYKDACDYLLAIEDVDKEYFKPFNYNIKSITQFLYSKSNSVYFLYSNSDIDGVFFLRFFITNQVFLGFYLSHKIRGRRVGSLIIKTLVYACKKNKFPLFSTVSKKNLPSWKAHLSNNFRIIKIMKKDYYLLQSR